MDVKQLVCFLWKPTAPISHGNNIGSLIGYFHARQYILFLQMKEFFNDVFYLSISEGGIHYLLNKLAKKDESAYEVIKQKLRSSNFGTIGVDETGVKVAGDKHWASVWQNEKATFISITGNRAP